MKAIYLRLAGLLCAVLSISAMMLAQGTQGVINGRVTDPSGAPVVGAKVTLTNTATAQTKEATTSSDGY